MDQRIEQILKDNQIELFGAVLLKDCHVLRPYKLSRAGFSESEELTALMMAVPYLTRHEEKNLSAYAISRDYHGFYKELFSALIPQLEAEFSGYLFRGFADDSPIDEREAAALAGLGRFGENGMLITEKYSSYVFLGEIITNMPIPEAKASPILHCEGCGLCKAACPMGKLGQCLSALTQKKGELTESEADAIKKYGTVWGCDICQEVCPHTLQAIKSQTIYTNLEYFKQKTIPQLTSDVLDAMSEEEFASRAYSWRGRQTIGRNLKIFED